MPSHYCVVQFVPDPVADERVNIGVLAFDGDKVRSSFLTDWRRPQALAGGSVDALRRILRDLEAATAGSMDQELLHSPSDFHRLTGEMVERIADRWSHAVQLTTPRASLADLDTVLAQVSAVMLKQSPPRRRAQSKLGLVRDARVLLERALAKRDVLGDSGRAIENRVSVKGKLVTHEVDLAIRNGKPLVAAQAISFGRLPSPQIQKDVNATAWVLDDIRQAKEHPHLAVIVGEPSAGTRGEFDDAVGLFSQLADGGVVRKKDLPKWAEDAAELALSS